MSWEAFGFFAVGGYLWIFGSAYAWTQHRMHPGWALTWPLWGALWLLVAIPKAVAWTLARGIPRAARAFARDFPRMLP